MQGLCINLRDPRGLEMVLLRAGGAARGALLPFQAQEPAELVIANRSVNRAHEPARIGAASGASGMQGCAYQDLAGQTFDAVFNATSASLRADLPPVPASVFAPGCPPCELAYGKGLTPLLHLAQNAGVHRLTTAWACWPNRPPKPSNGGAACGPTPAR